MKIFNVKLLAVAAALASGAALANEQATQGTQAKDPAARTAGADRAPSAMNAASEGKRKPAGAQSAAASGAKDAAAGAGSPDYAVLVVPVQVASNDQLNNGCWARVYENPNFGGSHLTIVGPLDVGRLEASVADDWNGADSLVTGSAATVTTYGKSDFREERRSYGPGQRATNLPSGPLEQVESLRVACRS